MTQTVRLWWHDLGWAGVIVVVAVVCGMWLSWSSINATKQMWEPPGKMGRQEADHFQGVNTINLAQTYEIFQKGEALFVDARAPEEFAELHIPGAVNLSPQMIVEKEGAAKIAAIRKDREIVVYCDQVSCDLSLKVAEKLQSMGFTQVRAFMQGFRQWDMAGYPAATSR